MMMAEIGLRPSHTNLPQRSRHSSRTRMRGAAVTSPCRASGDMGGVRPASRNAGQPGFRPRPKTWSAVSHVRVRGETTTRSNDVNERPPEGRVARWSRSDFAWATPTSVRRASHSAWSVGHSPAWSTVRQSLLPLVAVMTLWWPSAWRMKWIFFVLSARKIEKPLSGGPRLNWKLSPSIAVLAGFMPDRFMPSVIPFAPRDCEVLQLRMSRCLGHERLHPQEGCKIK